MTPIPPDAQRYVIAAVVPCPEDPPHHMLCRCFGTNECKVVTDIEVEREQMYAGPREAEWDTPEDVWVEVAL